MSRLFEENGLPLERYPLSAPAVVWRGRRTDLVCRQAVLYVDKTDEIELGWYVQIDGLADSTLLRELGDSPDIRVIFQALGPEGQPVSGEAFMHPNLVAQGAAVKGDGELSGYASLSARG